MSALYFDARIDGAQLQRDIANINRQIGQISTHMQKEGQEIDAISRRIGQGLAGAFSIFTAGAFVKDIAKVRGEFQQLEVAFETMLGSREQADKLMAEVVQFAARTPFELQDVASGTKQLLAFGVEAEKVIPTLKAMGDVSAGLSTPIERLILNYGQVRTQMKMTGRELRDFQVQGVPIVAELAKNLNVSEQAIAEMVSAGKIGFKEVEQAFQTMTLEGGRFSNLMLKQSETITGLASNFADAWDRMLNSIGKENEGIIAGSIKSAITLVDNYEEVIKVLKILIATYGTYKAAVIAVEAVEKARDIASTIRSLRLFTAGINSAARAQVLLNNAVKANPYVLLATTLAAIITALVVFRKQTMDTQEYVDSLNESIESIGKQLEVDNLINRYVELQDKTKRTEEEQNELNDTIKQLGGIFPNVISKTDEYGNAISLAKDKVIELNDELRENTRLATDKQVADAQDLLNQKIDERNQLLREVNEGIIQTTLFTPQGPQEMDMQLTEKDILKRREQIVELSEDIADLTRTIGESEGKLSQLGQIDAAKAMEPYKDLFGNVEEYSKEQALKIKMELTKLLGLGFGKDAEKLIKSEIDKIATELALPTVQDQIRQVLADLKNAEQQLAQLRAPGSRASAENIGEKEDEVKELQKKYDALTGVSKKEAEKALEDQKKEQEERRKALIEYHGQVLDLERQVQSSRIAIMNEGAERRRAEAELQYQMELDRIEQQQQSYVEAWNATKGLKPGDVGFISELPAAELDQFTQLRVNAEARKNKEIEQINKDAALEIKNIWQEVNDLFLSDSERAIQKINNDYDALIERAKRAGQTDFTDIERARSSAIEQAAIDSAMRRLDFEESIEMQRAEISTQGYNREIEVERKKLEIVKKFAEKKIEILQQTDTEQARQEAEQLEMNIAAADKGLEELNQRTLTESIAKIARMADEFKIFSDEIFGAGSNMSKVMGGIGELGSSFARIASGDYSGAISMLTSLSRMSMDTTSVENRLSKPWIEFEKWIAASNRELQRYIDLRDNAIGWERYTSTDTALEEMMAKMDDAQKKMLEMQMDFTFQGSGWFNEAYREVADQLKALEDQLGGVFNEETYKDWGIGFWKNVKAIYSYDLGQLLVDDAGEFTIEKINKLIDEAVITDQKVIEAVEYYEELLDKITQAEQQKQELLTATMAGNIADGIVDGFRQGYDSASDFADSFEELMKNAIFNALKIQALEEPLKEWYRQFAEFSESGGVLSADEIAFLEQAYNNIIESARERFEEMKRISNLDFSSDITGQQGLSGAIKGITEETASLIAGQFYAMREVGQRQYLTGLEQLDVMNQSVTHLAEIAANTRHNSKLVGIDQKLEDMNNYLKAVI